MKGLTGSIFLLIFMGILSVSGKAQNRAALMPGQAELEKMAARFAPTPLRVDTSKLSP